MEGIEVLRLIQFSFVFIKLRFKQRSYAYNFYVIQHVERGDTAAGFFFVFFEEICENRQQKIKNVRIFSNSLLH